MFVSKGCRGGDGQLTRYSVRNAADTSIMVSLHPEKNDSRTKPDQILDHTILHVLGPHTARKYEFDLTADCFILSFFMFGP